MQSMGFLASHFMDDKHFRVLSTLIPMMPFIAFVMLLQFLSKMRGRTCLIYTVLIMLTVLYFLVWIAARHSLQVLHQSSDDGYIDVLYLFFGVACVLAFIQEMHPAYWFKTDGEYLVAHPIPSTNPEIVNPYPKTILLFAQWVRFQKYLLLVTPIQILGAFFLFGLNFLHHPIWQTISFLIAFLIAGLLQGLIFQRLCKCLNCQRPFFTLAAIYKTGIAFKLAKTITKTHQFQCPTCSARYTVNTAANHSPKP